jgi:toxin ParE1/3/4
MEISIQWTDEAVNDLERIYHYYSAEASSTIAQNLVDSIIEATLYLQKNPELGQREELLKDRTIAYRYLLAGQYKVIYWIADTSIYIATIFDCRQNPMHIL